jgi:hypothetical protein
MVYCGLAGNSRDHDDDDDNSDNNDDDDSTEVFLNADNARLTRKLLL